MSNDKDNSQIYTHAGYQETVGYVHGAKLYGHADYRGKRHALNGTPNTYCGAKYTALCGKTVVAEHDGEKFNVQPAVGIAAVSCKRCLSIIRRKQVVTCTRCKKPIAPNEARESHAYPNDGRWVHSKCVGQLIGEVLTLMANVPDNVRLCDPEED